MASPVQAGQGAADTHVHGVGELDVIREGNALSVVLSGPLYNLLGSEAAPASDADRQKVKRAVAFLRSETALRFNPESRCKRVDLALTSDVLNPHSHAPGDDHQGHTVGPHSDVLMRWEYQCDNMAALQQLDVGLFKLFPLMAELRAQAVLPKRRFEARLNPASAVFRLQY
ncbi:DUF2796 domain-containing protein [Limnobacter humi]|uniref:DUF2796 domain-containing protein n=1 Tax=Limnobacter humi TaxID=1778671 RepID=A0ABT1WK28_9BURK|nr:DUF2796 domain-containing protein [Limnobacter humi]MCQ8897779.1 DUF2796 domain-containing protein [Limnobacter humi]